MVVVRDDGDVLFYGNVKSLLQESQQPSAQPQTLAERATSQSDVFVEVSDSKSGIILKARGTLENAAFSVAIEGDENMVEKLGLSALKQDIILLRKNLAADLEANVQKNLSNSGTSNSNKVMGQLQSSLSHNEEMILPLKNGMKIDVAIRLIMTGRDHGDMIPMKFTGSMSGTQQKTLVLEVIPNSQTNGLTSRLASTSTDKWFQNQSIQGGRDQNGGKVMNLSEAVMDKLSAKPAAYDTAFITKNATILLPATVVRPEGMHYQQIILHSPVGDFFLSSNMDLPEEVFVECDLKELLRGGVIDHKTTGLITPESAMGKIMAAMKDWLKQAGDLLEKVAAERCDGKGDKTEQSGQTKLGVLAAIFSQDADKIREMTGALMRSIKAGNGQEGRGGSVHTMISDSLGRLPDNMAALDHRLGNIYAQIHELNQQNNKWSFFVLPTYNNQIFQQVTIFVKNDPQDEQGDVAAGAPGKRVVVKVDSSEFGPIWIDTLLYKSNKRMDVIIRSEKSLSHDMIDGLEGLFTSLKSTINLEGTIDIRTQQDFSEIIEKIWGDGLASSELHGIKAREIIT